MPRTLTVTIDSPVAGEEVGQTAAVTGTYVVQGLGWPIYHVEGVRVRFGPGGSLVAAQLSGGPSGPVSWSCSGHLPPDVVGGQTLTLTATVHGHLFERTRPVARRDQDVDPDPDPDPDPEPEPEPEPEPIPFEQSVTISVRVRPPFVPGPVERVFEPASYLDELLSLANRYVSVGGALPGPTPSVLAGRLFQPLDRLTQPQFYEQASAAVQQTRIAVEVLRRALGAAFPSDQRYRDLAYQTLLAELGTTYAELRLARVASPAERAALAARLGMQLATGRPDSLDHLTISPEQITDAQLEQLFGYRSTAGADPLQPPGSIPAVLLSRQAALRSRWQRADEAERDGSDGPIPVIDPDVLAEHYLRSEAPSDPARALWTARRDWIATRLGEITADIASGGGTLAGFEALLGKFAGDIDLPALATRDAEGTDITGDLASFLLDLEMFRYLVNVRELLAAGELLDTEWQEVTAILVKVGKRGQAAAWRQEEQSAAITLQPATFVAPQLGSQPGQQQELPRWRADRATLAAWLATLDARIREAALTETRFRAVVEAAERVALPQLRDALVAEIGGRQTPAEPAERATDRLSRELCLDLRAGAGQSTDRIAHAVDTMQTLLVSVRSGRFAAQASGPPLTIFDEVSYDREWQWLVSYPRWVSAMRNFAYPENQLQPHLYRPETVTPEMRLAPSQSYQGLITSLASRRRLTPQDARTMAGVFVTALRSEVGSAVPNVVLTDQRTNAQLAAHRAQCATLSGGAIQESQIPQFVRELFWLVPIAFARKLHSSKEYAAALDWYQSVLAYQSPQPQRAIYHGLLLEAGTQSNYDRFPGWLGQTVEMNPHFTARKRRGAYTRFTVSSIVECLLAFADSEFARNTRDANARARALYQSAIDLLGLPEAASDTGATVPFPVNPVWESLLAQANAGLAKIHAGLNIGGFADTAATAEAGLFLPSPYRYATVLGRAKDLVTIAQQVESAYLAALERLDAENYGLLQAGHDLRVADAALSIHDLKIADSELGLRLAALQRDKSADLVAALGKRIGGGLNDWEHKQLASLRAARSLQEQANIGALFNGVFSQAFQIAGGNGPFNPFGLVTQHLAGSADLATQDARIAEVRAGFERRHEEWQIQQSQAVRDVQIGNQQLLLARNQRELAGQERALAQLQRDHAYSVAEFLATKFTNVELHEWMSGVLGRVYAYFLQQATALALLAQAQLAFERQEPSIGFIAADYWQDAESGANGSDPASDRRGMTGSARLLQDIYRLDQYAFQTARRRLALTQTLSLSQIAAHELQQFRQTGVLTFATGEELFNREFPGHYLRLIKRMRWTILALVPVARGLRGTLSTSGVSRTVVARGPFDTATLRREAESVAFTSPVNASGVFELEPDNGMLLPFEGMGVDAAWRLELPKAANPFDYNTIADVLVTIEYTALDSAEYRQKVVRALDRRFTGDRSFSVRHQFPDAWYELNNPETVTPPRRMRAVVAIAPDDLPPHITGLGVAEITLFVVRKDGHQHELTITSLTHTLGDSSFEAGEVTTNDGIIGTRRPAGLPWRGLAGRNPLGDWEIRLPDDPAVKAWFADGLIEDLVLVLTLEGTTPTWP